MCKLIMCFSIICGIVVFFVCTHRHQLLGMPCTISRDLKARIPIPHLEFGFSVKEICNFLGICKSLIYKTLQYQSTFGVSYNPHAQTQSHHHKLDQFNLTFIHDMIAQHHTLYLDEVQEELMTRRGTYVSIPTLA